MNTLLPIVTRELRVRARQPRTFYVRVGGATLVILIVGGLLGFVSGFSGAGVAGHGLFRTLVWGAYLFCLTEGLRSTADCLSEEKRAGTLGLLFLTDLRGYDVVLGKLLAAGLNSLYVLLAILPPLAVPILLGGVTGGEFWRAALALVATLFFSLSVGLLVSAISRDERRAWSATIFIVLAMAIVPPLIDLAAGVTTILPSTLGAVSPTTMLLSLWDTGYAAKPGAFWNALWAVTLLGVLALAAASWILPRAWQDENVSTVAKGSPARPTENAVRDARSPKAARRDQHLLAANPMLWLANRSTDSAGFIWSLAGIGIFWGATGLYWARSSLAGILVVCLGLLGLHTLMVMRIAWEACHQLAEPRDSGALEILLSTPLTPEVIINGHLHALRRLYLGPSLSILTTALVLFAVHSGVAISSRQSGPSASLLTFAAVVFWGAAFLDLHAAAHYGLWLGLKFRKPSQALSRTLLTIVGLPLLSAVCCWVIWPIVALVKNLVAMNYARDQLQRNFRDIVAARYETADDAIAATLRQLLPPKVGRADALPSVLPRKTE